MRVNNLIFRLSIILLGLIVYIGIGHYLSIRDFLEFDEDEIKGRILEIKVSQGAAHVRLEKQSNYHLLFIKPKLETDFLYFERVALQGDSIIKKSHSDSLILFKENKTIVFMINKPRLF